MSRAAGWWSIRRGPFAFAVAPRRKPRSIPGDRVWWTPNDEVYCGVVSGRSAPIGVFDVARMLGLPGGPLARTAWALAYEDDTSRWAVASDTEPRMLAEATERPVPLLPTEKARRIVSRAVLGADRLHLVIEPEALVDVHAQEADVLGEERILSRLARLTQEMERPNVRPELVVSRIGEVWCGLEAASVYMVVKVAHVTPLPGAHPIVWGLTAITGRVNMILDPARVLGGPSPSLPCWVAEVQTPGAKWGIAAREEWSALTGGEVREVEDRTPAPGPAGLIIRRVFHGERMVHVLSAEKLVELARGEDQG